jgi:glyoxylate reductase
MLMTPMPFKVLVTGRTFREEFVQLLRDKGYEVEHRTDQKIDESTLSRLLRDKNALLLGGVEYASRKVLQEAARLKVVAVAAVGYHSYVDVEAATRQGIAVTNTPEVNARATAEMTVALLLALKRQVPFTTRAAKKGRWLDDLISDNLYGGTLGIIGMGEIGSLVAEIMSLGFGMRVVYHSRSPKRETERRIGCERLPLEELLGVSDVVSLHVPITPETKWMIGQRQLKLMKRSAILVNTARPHVVAPRALYNALNENRIAGCAMDGYFVEPPPPLGKDRYGLLTLPDDKFIVTPHIGYLTRNSIQKMCEIATNSVISILEGRECPYVVNPTRVKVAVPLSER